MNYLAWTANLGVVPLFLLAAFLLAPDLRALAFLLFSVTAVLDAILSSYITGIKFLVTKTDNLSSRLLSVKIFLVIIVFLPCTILAEDLILAKGEQKELTFEHLKKYSVGNPDVLSYKFFPKNQKILLKGKKVGFSDLVVWLGKEKKEYKIYVLSKKKHLQTYQLAEALKPLDLTVHIQGPVIMVEGEIQTLEDYLYIHKLRKKHGDQVFFRATINPKLRNHIIGLVYHKLFAAGASQVSCRPQFSEIVCDYSSEEADQNFFKEIEKRYAVSFVSKRSQWLQKNYRLKMKLIQVERIDGREISTGLDQIDISMKDLFNSGLSKIVDENRLKLRDTHLDLSTLAEPDLMINLGHPQLIEIGSQIPYQNINTQGTNIIAPIDWRFAGLRIKTEIKEAFGKILVKYETEFSRPVANSISGSKEVSTVLVHPDEMVKIFQIGFQTEGEQDQSIPLLNQIPILKELFKSKTSEKTYKHINGYLVLEEVI